MKLGSRVDLKTRPGDPGRESEVAEATSILQNSLEAALGIRGFNRAEGDEQTDLEDDSISLTWECEVSETAEAEIQS